MIRPNDFTLPTEGVRFGNSPREKLVEGILKLARLVSEGHILIQEVNFGASVKVDDFVLHDLTFKYAEFENSSSDSNPTALSSNTIRDLIGNSGLLK